MTSAKNGGGSPNAWNAAHRVRMSKSHHTTAPNTPHSFARIRRSASRTPSPTAAGAVDACATGFAKGAEPCAQRASRRRELELQLVRDFQRRFVLSGLENSPPKQDILTWFALMRHYGVSGRLLDFTYSPYVALFMAIRQLLEDGGESRGCAVIAIRRNVFDRALKISFQETPKKIQGDIDRIRANDTEAFKSLFILNRNLQQPIIYPVMPYDLNRRLALQQGLFLCPSHIGLSVQENFDRFFAGLRVAGKWEGEYYDVIRFDNDEFTTS